MRTHTVAGGGGLKLHVREWGPADAPPILFIHGWSQHHLCWSQQFGSALSDQFRLVALDLRGHGQSEAPLAAEAYTRGELWADDIGNVISALKLHRPLLVGWSYGGFIIGDYLRRNGDDAISGVNLACGAIGIGPAWFGEYIGPGFLEYAPPACSEDQAVALDAIRAFLHRAVKKPLPAEGMELAMGWNMLVHPRVRAHLISREEDFTAEYARLRKPILVTYGEADEVVTPAMAKLIASAAPNSEMSAYPGVGHAPFLEDAARFNSELGVFARSTSI
ncbi:MAG: alpha/beta fold hydrolase [Caulobacteraceae bacterium]